MNGRGYKQVDGVHYNSLSVYLPVTDDISIRIVFVLGLMAGWKGDVIWKQQGQALSNRVEGPSRQARSSARAVARSVAALGHCIWVQRRNAQAQRGYRPWTRTEVPGERLFQAERAIARNAVVSAAALSHDASNNDGWGNVAHKFQLAERGGKPGRASGAAR